MLTDVPRRKVAHLARFLESDWLRTIDLPQNEFLLALQNPSKQQ